MASTTPTIDTPKMLFSSVLEEIKSRGNFPDLPTGIAPLDMHLWGLRRRRVTVIAGRTAEGKCLGIGTPVLMFNGIVKTVERLRVGDRLMGPDSTSRTITSITNGTDYLYDVTQRNGLTFRVNGAHILALESTGDWGGRAGRKNYSIGKKELISVSEYLRKSKKFKHIYKQYKVGIHFPEQQVLVPPYILGVWLGDGTESTTSVTTANNNIVQELTDYAKENGLVLNRIGKKKQPTVFTYRISAKHGQGNWQNHPNKFLISMQRMCLINNKHIPFCYLQNSEEVRLQLLAGLLDTDGSKNNKGYIFYNINKRLSEEVCFLARTLGLRSQCTKYMAKLKSRNFSCEAYKVTITGAVSKIPVRSKHKKQEIDDRPSYLRTNFKVVPVGYGSYVGFTIDNPDGLFLLGDCTVTHNSSMAGHIAWHLADIGKKVVYLSIEMSKEEITERFLCSFCEISSDDLRKGNLPPDFERKTKLFCDVWNKMNIRIINHGRTIAQVRQVMEMLHIEDEHKKKIFNPPDLLVIDHIQRISPEGHLDMRNAIVSYMNELEGLAVAFNMAVVVLSQINRDATKRKDRIPTLEDLKESGALEETAGDVILLHWPGKDAEVTDPKKWEYNVIIGKQRSGPSGITIPIEYQAMYYRFRWPQTDATRWERNGNEPPQETRKDFE